MAASKANIHQPLRGEVKQKIIAGADRRTRKVLQDIGNLVNDGGALQGKKPLHGRGPVATKAAKKEVACENRIPETVIVISSDDESEKGKPVGGRTKPGSSRKNVKTLTAILTARSKAACGLSKKSDDALLNIDAADVNNELAVVEYVDDIYKFYKLTEADSRVHDYMHIQPGVNARMRSILVDWLVEVHRKFELMPETLYLTITIMDRFLAGKIVSRKELQLVGIGAMLIACKYEEIWAPEVNDFICISDNAYVREQVLAMEKAILEKLEWYLTVPTPYVFLVRYIKASVPSDDEMENMVFFLAELGLMQYDVVVNYCPSMIAASAVYAARCNLVRTPLWTEILKHITGYTEDMLKDCARLLAKFHSASADSKFKAVLKKFSSAEHGAVALRNPAKGLLLGI